MKKAIPFVMASLAAAGLILCTIPFGPLPGIRCPEEGIKLAEIVIWTGEKEYQPVHFGDLSNFPRL
ncbi:MAG: hypothetical protein HUJ54_12320 [Erysipelotrichaceae bacterium]|nr:hypothetical protein [Erysipelotrichaceae bacterium]